MRDWIRCFTTALLVLFLASCNSSHDVGPGVLHFEDIYSQRLEFYNTPDSNTAQAFHVDLIVEDTVRRVHSSLEKGIDTLYFSPLHAGSSSVSFQVLEQKDNWYKVYTDDIIGVAHWIYVDDREKESWRSFWPTVKRVFSEDTSNPIRENPSENAKAYPLKSERLCLRVLEVHGAWLKVQNAPERCPNSYVIREEFEGFLRWKKDGEVLINFRM